MSKTEPSCLHVQFTSFLLILLLSRACSQLIEDQEQATLLNLKQHWQNPPAINHWAQSSNSTSHCSWPEITCTNNSVTGIALMNINITETIPPFICDLKNLTFLDLHLNFIPGEFPRALYNCSKLEYLDLSQNYFVGPIPDDIDRLSRLYYLSVEANNFSGNIPAAIGRLQDMRTLQLNQNQFNGSFPPDIGNLSELETLELAYNIKFLPSRLPSSFVKLRKLKTLRMSNSNLFGEIPDTIGDMEALELLDLSENNMTGKVPGGLFMLKNLSELYLYKNRLSGDIPQVAGAVNLVILDLSENNLTGTIPEDIKKLEKLSGLLLHSNQLSGEVPQSLGQLFKLTDIKLFSNKLTGTLPPDIGRYSFLEAFEVASNRFTGKLPEHLCYGGKLQGVVAFDNNLSGELPESLGNCSSLEVVLIFNNSFTGNIPEGLWTSLNLTTLMISDNAFSGELPDKVSAKLSQLDVSNNRFFGSIPSEVDSWSNMQELSASNNLLIGTIPRELTALPSLTILLLDGNQLQGSLPSDIISWKSLNTLNLSQNQLSGQIPSDIGSLPVLSVLDLSNNQFSGKIFAQIGSLTLTFLNLSSNHLTGEIPNKFENAAFSDSFVNNSGLCANTKYVNLNTCGSPQTSGELSSKRLAPILISVIAVTAALLALVLSFLVIRSYQWRKNELDATWKFTSFQRLNFTESNILSGLMENNMIGSGGSGKVYLVTVTPREVVAVKKIWSERKIEQKLEKEFRAEVQILSTIRHLNVVKLLCCISSEDSKLLVYEYVENRSLDQWLHKKNRSTTTLDWSKRLHIAIGAAQGLCYMHHDCSPPIVHRDVKSSNVLLDSNFNAKIADFGLAKMLTEEGEAATMSVVAGSFGYIAPEYARTRKVNEKVDVYSFGVILLELTTGREANYGDEHSSLAEWAWRHIREGNPVDDALDEEIKEPCCLEEMSHVFKLGIICTAPQPSERPRMKEVLELLLQTGSPSAYRVTKKARNEHDAAPLLKNLKQERTSTGDACNFV